MLNLFKLLHPITKLAIVAYFLGFLISLLAGNILLAIVSALLSIGTFLSGVGQIYGEPEDFNNDKDDE